MTSLKRGKSSNWIEPDEEFGGLASASSREDPTLSSKKARKRPRVNNNTLKATPVKAVGTILTLSNLTHKFPENLGSSQLNLLPAMIDFTLFEDEMRLMENVHIEFSHDEFDIPNGYFGQVSNIYCHLLFLYVMLGFSVKRRINLCILEY